MVSHETSEEDSRPSHLWGKTTDPRNHNPDGEWRYLVTGDVGEHIMKPRQASVGKVAIRASQGCDPDSAADHRPRFYIDNLDALTRASIIHASLIDQDHRYVHQFRAGLVIIIIDVPGSSVIATHHQDTAGAVDRLSLDDLASHYSPRDPDEILEQTTGFHNEIICRGEGLSIAGISILSQEWRRDPMPNPDPERIQAIATKMGVPLITLPPK